MMTRFNQYSVAVVLIVTISLVAAGVAITFRVNRITEQKFCDIAESNVAVYRDTPPTTETGRAAASNWNHLYESLHCPPE